MFAITTNVTTSKAGTAFCWRSVSSPVLPAMIRSMKEYTTTMIYGTGTITVIVTDMEKRIQRITKSMITESIKGIIRTMTNVINEASKKL